MAEGKNMGDIKARLTAIGNRVKAAATGTGIGVNVRVKGEKIAFDLMGYGHNFALLKTTHGWFTEDEAEALIARRLGSIMGVQRAMGDRLGGPPLQWTSHDDVDLTPYWIEEPVLASMMQNRNHGEVVDLLRRSIFYGKTSDRPYRATYIPSDDGLRIEMLHGIVRGSLQLAPGIRWKGGTITMTHSLLPDTILAGLKGAPLSRLLAHPFLGEGIDILNVRQERRSGPDMDVTVVATKGASVPLTAALAAARGLANDS